MVIMIMIMPVAMSMMRVPGNMVCAVMRMDMVDVRKHVVHHHGGHDREKNPCLEVSLHHREIQR